MQLVMQIIKDEDQKLGLSDLFETSKSEKIQKIFLQVLRNHYKYRNIRKDHLIASFISLEYPNKHEWNEEQELPVG